MTIESVLRAEIDAAVLSVCGEAADVQLQPTNPEFEGTHTVVCFPLTRKTRKSPEETARLLGEALLANKGIVQSFSVVKGFLNLALSDTAWFNSLRQMHADDSYGQQQLSGAEIMIEYSSPNTNKPLHLGHLRNNFLGWSVSELYTAIGYKVHRVQIINDRGIHICKSMAAWQLFGDGETPASSGIKGDHLVGKYYVEFNKAFKAQTEALVSKGLAQEEAEKETPVMKLAAELLRKWEQGDEATVELWRTMNGWVYKGFEATYASMGVTFDKLYYESETWMLGKDEILKGVEAGIFFRKPDGSVWVDLTAEGLDQKVLLRSDGTSVYITQDIGTAILRFRDFPQISGQIYTVGNEQEYHFKVLFLILAKLGYAWAQRCFHLSYGMVELPEGKMKSREGTVVDADDLMAGMIEEAERQTRELGKLDDMDGAEAGKLFRMIGLGALKFFLLKVDPKKRMLFDPAESIALQGFTGPFIQYTHARIKALLRKAAQTGVVGGVADSPDFTLEPAEREVIFKLSVYESRLQEAAREYSPAIIANYVYELAREFNQFYQAHPVLGEPGPRTRFRLALSETTARVISNAMKILGIEVPERM